jgi:transmembrane sensor
VTSVDFSDGDYDRAARFLAGEMSAADRAEFESWVSRDAALREALSAAGSAFSHSRVRPSVDVDAAWRKFKNRIELADDTPVMELRTGRRWWSNGGVLLRAAAALAVIAGTAEVWRRVSADSTAGSATVASVAGAFETARGERRSINLPDGSQVELGVASSLMVAAAYGAPAREVTLSGEAFFRVEHDQARPFRVLARGAVVEDLGTEFAIRAYDADSALRVAVVSGEVSVKAAESPVHLAARDVAVVSAQGAVAVIRGVDVEAYSAFSAGRLVFDNATLGQVFAELERWYDVEIRVTDAAVRARRLTVPFEPGATLDTVLQTIELTIEGVRFSRRGDRGRIVELAAPTRTGMTAATQEQVGGGA